MAIASQRQSADTGNATLTAVDQNIQAIACRRVELSESHREPDAAHRINYRSVESDRSRG
jgi:hypothetical protein